jgi:hypothetical protein
MIIYYYCIFHQNIAIVFWQQNWPLLKFGKEMKLPACHFMLSRISGYPPGYPAGYPVSGLTGYPVSGFYVSRISGQIITVSGASLVNSIKRLGNFN